MCDLCGACRQFTSIVLFALLIGLSFGLGGYAVKLYLLLYTTEPVTVQELLAADSDFWEYNWEYSLWFTGVWVGVFVAGLVVYIAVTQTVTCFVKWVLLRILEALARMVLWCFPCLDCGCMGRKRRSAREAFLYAQAPVSYEMDYDPNNPNAAPLRYAVDYDPNNPSAGRGDTRPRSTLPNDMPAGIRMKRAQSQPQTMEEREMEQEMLELV